MVLHDIMARCIVLHDIMIENQCDLYAPIKTMIDEDTLF